MRNKIFANTLYNLGIILCGILGYEYGVLQKQYVFLAIAAFILVTFIVFKIRLYKDLKEPTQKP